MKHDQHKPLALTFTPVAIRPRWNGWTPEKQIAFVEALSETACVEESCRIVAMSAVSAYALRRRPCARHFREAWDAALDMGVQRLEQAALGRALNGVARPLFHKGEQVGEWREYDERLTMFLLRYRRPTRFGAALDGMVPDPRHPQLAACDDAAQRLDFHCDEIAGLADDRAEDRAEDRDDDPDQAPSAPDEPPRA